MIIRLLSGLFFASLFALAPTFNVYALGLKVAPLEYRATLKEGEKQQGFVDVSNPSAQVMSVKISVQAFKQIDNDGGLQFFDDPQVGAGIKPELTEAELGPREAIRLFFTIDGGALPEGDVYAAIFFTTDPKQPSNGVGQLVRVGTLLSLINKTPGERKAEVTGVSIPLLQLTDTVKGSYAIRNISNEGSGFYPSVEVSSWPAGKSEKKEGSLIFGGRERTNDFSYQTGFGIHNVQVAYGDSNRSQWVISIAPWMLVLALLITLIVGIELLLLKRRRKTAKKLHKKPTPTS